MKNGFSRQKASHNKHMPQYEKRVQIFFQGQSQTYFKNILWILQDILLINFLTLEESLEYFSAPVLQGI